jgi:MYXO-CTERM domain-containing protein
VLEKIVRWHAAIRGADDSLTLERVLWLAYAERMTGAWAASERHYQMVIGALERTRQTDLVLHDNARRALIALYVDKGDLEHAEPVARKLLAEAQARSPASVTEAKALVEVARVRQRRGAFADAEALLVRALGMVQAHGDPARRSFTDSPHGHVLSESRTREGEVAILAQLARVLLDEGKLADAERAARLHLDAAVDATGPDDIDAAIALHDLGLVLAARGDTAGAWGAFTRSLALRGAASGDHPVLATVLHSMARLRLAQGAGAEAEALGRRALALVEESHGPEHRRVADVLEDVAEALVEQGRPMEALPLEERAAAIRDRDAQVILAVGSEAQKRMLVAEREKLRDATIAIAGSAGSAGARLALRTTLRDKGRLADASAQEMAALRARLDDAGRAAFDDLARVTAAISASAARGETAQTSQDARARLARLEAERLRLEALIADRSAAYRADEALATVENVARRLPDDAALVEVVLHRPFLLPSASAPRPSSSQLTWGPPRYLAYVLRRGEVTAVDLGVAEEIDRAVVALRAALGNPDLSRDPKPAARAVHDRIFEPLAGAIDGATHVLWSPDGALQLVPLAALVGADGRYLAESRLVTYLTSGRDLLRFDEAAAPRSGPLVLGAPDFGALPGPPSHEATHRGAEERDTNVRDTNVRDTNERSANERSANERSANERGANERGANERGADEIDLRRVGFLPLPGTAREAEAVADALSTKVVLTGDKATESAVKWAHAPSVLHVATHGFFLPGVPAAVAPDIEVTGSEAALALSAESPLVRSGLAFAGANQRASGTEDGILTGLEASSLDLFGTELVVLSACETGLGAAVPGDGVHGLRRAFAIAGAETLVMSLWQVDTGRTRELMTAYYRSLAAGAGRSEAMRRAQLGMLASKATSHPNVWASFIVSGRWGPLGARSLGPPRVEPGPRGCGCELAEERGSPGGAAIAIMGIALAALRRRRGWCWR